MGNWSARWRALDQLVQRFGAWWTVAVVAFGAAVAAMTWVTKSISFLSGYGWGVPVLAAIGIICAIVLALSFAAVPATRAWRNFYPVSPATFRAATTPSPESQESAISKLEREMVTLQFSLPPLKEQSQELTGKIDEIERQIVELRGKSTMQSDGLARTDAKSRSDYLNLERKFGFLIDAIRAHHAEGAAKEADKIVSSLGPSLLSATDYPDQQAWSADYRVWHDSLSAIDREVNNLGVVGHTPFLEISRRELENCSEMPPETIRGDRTIVPYRTVYLAQRRYAEGREQMFHYFAAKGALPG